MLSNYVLTDLTNKSLTRELFDFVYITQ